MGGARAGAGGAAAPRALPPAPPAAPLLTKQKFQVPSEVMNFTTHVFAQQFYLYDLPSVKTCKIPVPILTDGPQTARTYADLFCDVER